MGKRAAKLRKLEQSALSSILREVAEHGIPEMHRRETTPETDTVIGSKGDGSIASDSTAFEIEADHSDVSDTPPNEVAFDRLVKAEAQHKQRATAASSVSSTKGTEMAAKSMMPCDTSQQRPSRGAFLGFVLLSIGCGGLLAYPCIYLIPPIVTACLVAMLVGVAVLSAEIRADDEFWPGLSIFEITASLMNSHKDRSMRMMMLFALPGEVTARDVEVLFRDFDAVDDKLIATATGGGDSTAHSITKVAANGVAIKGPARTNEDDAFDEAVTYLRQPRLALGISTQLRLRGVYLQAVVGDAGATESHDALRGVRLLPRELGQAQLEDWRRMRGVPRPMARARLPMALAEVDPAYAAAHPRFLYRCRSTTAGASPGISPLASVALKLLERRLPVSLEQSVRQLASIGCVVAALSSCGLPLLLPALRNRRTGLNVVGSGKYVMQRWPRLIGMGTVVASSLLSGLASLYLLALARGLPAWLLLRLRNSSCRGLLEWLLGQCEQPWKTRSNHENAVVARLQQRLCSAFIPGVSRSIFTDDA